MSTQSRYGLCQSVCGCVMAPSLMWLWRNIKVRRCFFCCCFFSNLVKKLGGRMQLLNCNVGVCRNTERAEMSSAKVTHPGLCGLCVLCQWFNWSFLPHRLWVWTPWKRQVEWRKNTCLTCQLDVCVWRNVASVPESLICTITTFITFSNIVGVLRTFWVPLSKHTNQTVYKTEKKDWVI